MRNKSIFINSGVSFVSQISTLVLQFISRSVFVKYIGVELLGLSGTFSSILSTLSLAELGFQSAIVYCLYQPLHDKDYNQVNKIVNIFRVVYQLVGIFMIAMCFVLMPFLKFILSDIQVTYEVCLYFFLQTVSTACTYFLAYRRTLLYADKKEYVYRVVDAILHLTFTIAKLIMIVLYNSYLTYLIVTIIQAYLSNIIVYVKCNKIYPFLEKQKIDVPLLKNIMSSVKNVMIGRLAGYVYTSTDGLVISTFVSTIKVGYYANYQIITSNLKFLIQSILGPIAPIIGNLLIDKDDTESRFDALMIYTSARYLICIIFVAPFIVLANIFIDVWVGTQYVLSFSIVLLMGIDLYIDIVHSALYDYIVGSGLFREEKRVEIVGALLNIIVSICLSMKFGIAGVLLGTVISQIWFWMGRFYVVFEYCIPGQKVFKTKYITSIFYYSVMFAVDIVIGFIILGMLSGLPFLFKFIIGGVLCEIVNLMIFFAIFGKTKETKIIVRVLKTFIQKIKYKMNFKLEKRG